MSNTAGVERRSAYARIAGTVASGGALLIGAAVFAFGISVLAAGNEPQGRLVTGIGVVLFVLGAIGSALLVVDRVRRRYPD